MEVLEDGHRIVCLYQLIDGSVTSSFARHIAHLAGLPPEVLERAAEVAANHLSSAVVLFCLGAVLGCAQVTEAHKNNKQVHRVDSEPVAQLLRR